MSSGRQPGKMAMESNWSYRAPLISPSATFSSVLFSATPTQSLIIAAVPRQTASLIDAHRVAPREAPMLHEERLERVNHRTSPLSVRASSTCRYPTHDNVATEKRHCRVGLITRRS